MANELNPFGQQGKTQAQSTSLVEVESQRAMQEVQAAMVIAKKFPRNQIEAMDRILEACTRPTLADSALYSYSRGGSEITGPSIRLAEAIAQTWGNMQFGIRELSQANGESTVESFAWDLETNTRQTKLFTVPHIRYTKNGSKRLEDPRDIYELVANQGARRLRACILGVIPGDVIESAVKQCEITQNTNADNSPEAIRKMVEAFAAFGVTAEMIQKRVQKRIEAINPAQMVMLRKIYTSLRDQMSVVADWFEGETSTKTLKDVATKKPDPAPAPQETAPSPDVGSLLDDALFALREGDIDGARSIAGELSKENRAIFDKELTKVIDSSN